MPEKPVIAKIFQSSLTLGSALALGAFCFFLFAPQTTQIDSITTATIQSTQSGVAERKDPAVSNEVPIVEPELVQALEALDQGDIETVIAIRDKMDENDVDRSLVTWLIATSGRRDVPAAELRDAQKRLDGWPGQDAIAKNLEVSMAQDPISVMRLRLSMDEEEPRSFQAAYAIAKTHLLTGGSKKARALLLPYWHDKVLSSSDEQRILENFADVFSERDHEIRYFNMMSRNRITSGGRIAKHLNREQLHDAWSAVIRGQKSAASKMEKLDEDDKKTAAYSFMRTEFLRRSGKDEEAIAVLADVPADEAYLMNPDAWWDERRIISRHKFELGDSQAAYDLVAGHLGGSDKTQIDAAFHAGWFALRGLKKPNLAATHFEKIVEIAQGDISKARGHYWLGRARTDSAEAQKSFKKAAEFDTTYYGWLAQEELGMTSHSLMITESYEDSSQALNPALQAADRLVSLGQTARARTLYTAMGWSWIDPTTLKRAANRASKNGDHFAALKIAKGAQWRGIDMGTLTHPLGAISDATGIEPNDHALAYSIARQESEFNISAVSKANAKGLMQVLPGTAKEMSRKINVKFEPARLTTDANYNARMGVAYLNEQLEKFGGSYVLTFAAYNAGPSRAKEWVERFGDPRGKPLYEVIDWVEMIPFPETRSYVQRILENFQVYKSKLGQRASIAQDLRFGITSSN